MQVSGIGVLVAGMGVVVAGLVVLVAVLGMADGVRVKEGDGSGTFISALISLIVSSCNFCSTGSRIELFGLIKV